MTAAVSGSILRMPGMAAEAIFPAARRTGPHPPAPAEPPAPCPASSIANGDLQPPADAAVRTRKRFWSACILASALLHGAVAAAFAIDWHFTKDTADAPPAAMVVELAVLPAAPAVQPSEISPGPEQVQAAPKPISADRMKFDPPPEVDAALKPEFALPARPMETPVETAAVAAQTLQTTAPPAIQAPPLDRSEAPVEGNNAAPPSDAEQAWEGRILARLERNKRYPAAAQAAGQQDTVYLRLSIDRRGRLLDAAIKRSSGFALLDSETLELARRAGPYPQPPASVPGERIVRVVPVEFYIKRR